MGATYDPDRRYGAVEAGYEHPVGRDPTLGVQGNIGKDLGPEGASAKPDWGVGVRGRVRFEDGGTVPPLPPNPNELPGGGDADGVTGLRRRQQASGGGGGGGGGRGGAGFSFDGGTGGTEGTGGVGGSATDGSGGSAAAGVGGDDGGRHGGWQGPAFCRGRRCPPARAGERTAVWRPRRGHQPDASPRRWRGRQCRSDRSGPFDRPVARRGSGDRRAQPAAV